MLDVVANVRCCMCICIVGTKQHDGGAGAKIAAYFCNADANVNILIEATDIAYAVRRVTLARRSPVIARPACICIELVLVHRVPAEKVFVCMCTLVHGDQMAQMCSAGC